MCFSASSSFTASILLTGMGLLALKNNRHKNIAMFAAIPLIFGLQQACEGVVWLTINDTTTMLHKVAANAFLLIAAALWPTWIPYSMAMYDHGMRKKILYGLTTIGACIAGYIIYVLVQEPTHAVQVKNSIIYHMGTINPFNPMNAILIYTVPTILPFFVTTIPYAKLGGIATIISLCLAYYIRYETFGSVWCFFAAILSIFIIFSVDKVNKKQSNML